MQIGTKPEGPWAAGTNKRPCDLASADKSSFCAGPVVHQEMGDPSHPSAIVVTYAVDTTAPGGAALRAKNPDDYWPRLTWTSAP